MAGRIDRFHGQILSLPDVSLLNPAVHPAGRGCCAVEDRRGSFQRVACLHLRCVPLMQKQLASKLLFPQMRRPHMVVVPVCPQDPSDVCRVSSRPPDIRLDLLIALRRSAVDQKPPLCPFDQIDRGIKKMCHPRAAHLVNIM